MAARWCLRQAGLTPADVDLIGFSYDPALVLPAEDMGLDDPWDELRTAYAARAPEFLAEELPGLDPARARFVRHHVAHAASAGLAAGPDAGSGDCALSQFSACCRNVLDDERGSMYLSSRLSDSTPMRKSSARFFCLSGNDFERSSPSGSGPGRSAAPPLDSRAAAGRTDLRLERGQRNVWRASPFAE